MSLNHLERARDAASYTDRLLAELARLSGELNHFRGASGLELLRDRSSAVQVQLELIATRLDALGKGADPGRYPLSDAEHISLEIACDLRERLVESLARYQRAQDRSEHKSG
jgi:hypothetical protein